MQTITPAATSARSFERFLTVVASAACLIICARIWQTVGATQPMWPIPALYLIEMIGLSLLGLVSVMRDHPLAGAITWGISGATIGFGVMGAWSIGLFFLPIALLFGLAAISLTRRLKQRIAPRVALAALAALTQAALMLLIIRLLYPPIIF